MVTSSMVNFQILWICIFSSGHGQLCTFRDFLSFLGLFFEKFYPFQSWFCPKISNSTKIYSPALYISSKTNEDLSFSLCIRIYDSELLFFIREPTVDNGMCTTNRPKNHGAWAESFYEVDRKTVGHFSNLPHQKFEKLNFFFVNIRRLKLYCWPQFWRFSNFHKNYTILGFHQSQSFSLFKMRRLCYFASYVIFDRAWALYLFWPMMCLYAFYKKFKYCRLDRFDIFVTNGIWHAILKFQNITPISPHVTFMIFRGCTAKLFDWLLFNHGGAEEQNVILTESESSKTTRFSKKNKFRKKQNKFWRTKFWKILMMLHILKTFQVQKF